MSTVATTTATATKACTDCRHYQQTSAEIGECRRHAPQTVVFQVDAKTQFESRFPSTKPNDWCGDFSIR